MPRIETYVSDETYMKLLKSREQFRVKSVGAAAKYAIVQFFSRKTQDNSNIIALNEIIQELNNKNKELNNHIKHLEMKLKQGGL